jgi:hypothetical protein
MLPCVLAYALPYHVALDAQHFGAFLEVSAAVVFVICKSCNHDNWVLKKDSFLGSTLLIGALQCMQCSSTFWLSVSQWCMHVQLCVN